MTSVRDLLPLLFFATFLAGCAGLRGVADPDMPAGFPRHTVDDITELIAADTDHLNAFSARANLVISSPIQSGRFSSDINHRRADSLLMTISPGLGIEAARALVTPDSFFVLDRIRRELTYGSVEAAGGTLPSVLVGDHLFENLLGLVQPDRLENWRLQSTRRDYVLVSPDGQISYTIDPTVWRVTRYEERLADGSLVEERLFSEFENFGGVMLPRRVVLNRPADNTAVSIHYRSINLNPQTLNFDLRAGENVRHVPVY
jgi:hypothetical protein